MHSEDIAQEETRRLLRSLRGDKREYEPGPRPSLQQPAAEAQQSRRWTYRWTWIGVILMAAAAITALSLRDQQQEAQAVPTSAHAGSAPHGQPPAPQTSATDAVLEASGFVVATRQATVSAEATGRVTRLLVAEGTKVKRGEVIAELDSSVPQAQVAQQEARVIAVENAAAVTQTKLVASRRNFDRSQGLTSKGFISKSQFDDAGDELAALEAQMHADRSEVDVARKQLVLQRRQLENTRIVSPFDGVVTEVAARVGEIVSPMSAGGGFTRTGVCTIVDLSSLEGEIDVNEQYLGRVSEGQPVRITAPAYSALRVDGRVTTVTAAVDRSTAAVKVRVKFDDAEEKLIPGMRIDVAFDDAQESGKRARSDTAERLEAPS